MLTKLAGEHMNKVHKHNKVAIFEYYRQFQRRPKNSKADLRLMRLTESVVSAKVVHVKGELIMIFNAELFRLSR